MCISTLCVLVFLCHRGRDGSHVRTACLLSCVCCVQCFVVFVVDVIVFTVVVVVGAVVDVVVVVCVCVAVRVALLWVAPLCMWICGWLPLIGAQGAWFCLNGIGVVCIRSMDYPDGLPGVSKKDKMTLRVANVLTRNVFKVLTACCRAGIKVSVENPHTSLLWRCSAYQHFIQKFSVQSVVVDYCQFGENYRKRTRIITYDPDDIVGDSFLAPLRRTCPGLSANHSHVNLSGWRPLVEGVLSPDMRPTKGTAAYPVVLCHVWARAVASACH